MNPNEWTKTLPVIDGFYWYRERGEKPQIIEWDNDMQWLLTTGSDIPWGLDMFARIEGEFWSQQLFPPQTLQFNPTQTKP